MSLVITSLRRGKSWLTGRLFLMSYDEVKDMKKAIKELLCMIGNGENPLE